MSWLPKKIAIDERDKPKNMAKRAVQSDLTAIEVFNREDGANHKDATIRSNTQNQSNNKVTVNIEIKEFVGEEKRELMENLGFDEDLQKHLNKVYQTPGQSEIKVNPDTLFDDETVITCLYSQDVNAAGLTGPEFKYSDLIDLSDARFIGFYRSDGANIKIDYQSIGTNGIGKTVLWKNSDYSCNMVYSNLSQPYTDERTGTEIQKRFRGLLMLINHYVDDTRYNSDIYFGTKHEGHDETFSFWNEEAEDFAERLHFPSFGNMPGTCSMVVGFNSGDENIEDNDQLFDEIINSYSMYFWPAIINNQLEVNVKYKNRQETVNPKANALSKHYVKLYQGIIKAPSDAETITVQTPKFNYIQGGEEETVPASSSVMVCAAKPFDTPSHDRVNNRYAILRGSNIVVSYELFNRRGFDSNNIGLVLAGTAVPEGVNGYNLEGQNAQEKLISLAEPVAHDKWNPNQSDNLPYGTKNSVYKILRAFKKKINLLTLEAERIPINNAETIISKFLTLSGKGIGKPSKRADTSFETVRPLKLINDGDRNYFDYAVDVKVPKKLTTTMLPDGTRPSSFGVKIEVKPRDEFGASVGSEIKMKCVKAKTVEISVDDTITTTTMPVNPQVSYYSGEYTNKKLTHSLEFRSDNIDREAVDETAYNRKVIIKRG